MAIDTPWAPSAGLTPPILDLASLSTDPARRRIFSLLLSPASHPSLQKLSTPSKSCALLPPVARLWPPLSPLGRPPPLSLHPFRLVNLRSNNNAPPPPSSARRSSVTRPNS